MESKAGSILLLISAILTFIFAFFFIIAIFVMFFFPASIENFPTGTLRTIVVSLYIFMTVAVIVSGFLKLWASRLMKNPSTTKKGGIIALVVGIANMGDILAIIGGVVGIMQAGEKKEIIS